MSTCFRILCALTDQRALCTTDEEVSQICGILLSGSKAPLPALANVKHMLSILQEIHDCLAEGKSSNKIADRYSIEPSLLRQSTTESQLRLSSHMIRAPVDGSALSKSMLDHSMHGPQHDYNAEKSGRSNEDALAADVNRKRTQKSLYDARQVAEKNKYATERYMERMNRAHILKTGATRLEKMNGCVPLSHRRAREIQSTQALEKSLDPLQSNEAVAAGFTDYTASYSALLYK